jgi:hypothetical protein
MALRELYPEAPLLPKAGSMSRPALRFTRGNGPLHFALAGTAL